MRSLTEYITNHTVLSADELEVALPKLLDPSEGLPPSTLPTFLHEATHHWCFSSPVGTTLALLAMRGRLRALLAVETADAGERRERELKAAEDLTRAAIVSEVLRPLAEGLATFAEFDVLPKLRAPAIPAPLRWAILACNRDLLQRDRTKKDWVGYRNEAAMRTSAELIHARSTTDVRNRRIDVLQQPLSCMRLPTDHPHRSKEGYLPGYLAIKNLWRAVEGYNEYIRLADFYLLFVYEHFYEDEGLIRVLLDETASAPASLNPIVEYLWKRLAPMEAPLINDFCARMSDVRKAAHDNDLLFFPSHAGDRNPNLRANELWRQVLGEERPLLPPPSDASTASHFAFLLSSLAHGRDLLRVGDLSVEAHVGPEDTIVGLPGGTEVSLPTDVGAPQGMFEAVVKLCLGTRSGHHVVYVVTRKRTLLAFQVTPAASSRSDWEALRRAVLGREAAELCDLLISLETEKLNQLRELTRINGYVSQTTERLDAIYVPLALMTVPEAVVKEAFVKMQHDGIYGLLDERDDLLRALAIMRRGAGFAYTEKALRDELAKVDIDLDIVVRDLGAYDSRFKLFGFQAEMGISCTL